MNNYSMPVKRLYNLIIFVLKDQAIMAEAFSAQKPKDLYYKSLSKAVAEISTNAQYVVEITDWISEHLAYVDDPQNALDPHYYEMIVDGMNIIYYDDFYKIVSGSDYAFDCEKKYVKYINKRED